jgi:hypothetical protein
MQVPDYIGEWVDCERNLLALGVHFDSRIRTLETQRARITSSPNAETLREIDIKAVDRELEPLRLKAMAAHEGMLYHDSRDVGGCDPRMQTWISMAIKAGRYVTPDTFGPSLHAQEEDSDTPLRVVRGRESGLGAFDLGNPTMSTAGR